MAAAEAGARGVTHLFNAMSQLQHRAPGVVGAALDHGGLWCGIIADGHHVHPAALAAALRAKKGPARLFLVTDAMPTAGDAGDVFYLNGRKVTRQDGLLTLEDGTLAGSDLTMDAALRSCHRASRRRASAKRCAWRASIRRSSSGSTTGAGGSRPAFAPTSSISTTGSPSRPCWIGGQPAA